MLFASVALCLTAAPDWKTVQPGVEYRAFTLEAKPATGDGLAHVVRIDASVATLDFGLAGENDGTLRTGREWCLDRGFSVVINAGMYSTDEVSNVGYLRHGAKTNNGSWNSKYHSVLGFGPREKGLPAARIWDRDVESIPDGKYEGVVQNLRLLKGKGESVWKPNGDPWSEALIAIDDTGRLLFIFVRTAYEMADLNRRLLELGLGLVRAMHVEGGPEASLSIHSKTVTLDLAGGPRQMPFGAEAGRQWRIPNVVGVRAR